MTRRELAAPNPGAGRAGLHSRRERRGAEENGEQ
jgi:hypothetical protein